jgi:hypothetical protein
MYHQPDIIITRLQDVTIDVPRSVYAPFLVEAVNMMFNPLDIVLIVDEFGNSGFVAFAEHHQAGAAVPAMFHPLTRGTRLTRQMQQALAVYGRINQLGEAMLVVPVGTVKE